jgi:hypothetical protein
VPPRPRASGQRPRRQGSCPRVGGHASRSTGTGTAAPGSHPCRGAGGPRAVRARAAGAPLTGPRSHAAGAGLPSSRPSHRGSRAVPSRHRVPHATAKGRARAHQGLPAPQGPRERGRAPMRPGPGCRARDRAIGAATPCLAGTACPTPPPRAAPERTRACPRRRRGLRARIPTRRGCPCHQRRPRGRRAHALTRLGRGRGAAPEGPRRRQPGRGCARAASRTRLATRAVAAPPGEAALWPPRTRARRHRGAEPVRRCSKGRARRQEPRQRRRLLREGEVQLGATLIMPRRPLGWPTRPCLAAGRVGWAALAG